MGRIRSEFVTFTNRSGLRLAACLDHGDDLSARPWVVVAPKYGETKKNNLQLAYFLAANGLNVLRFDHANHVGESAGDQTFFTLVGGAADILSCGDYLERTYGVTAFTLVANSLSARTAIRAAAEDARIVHLVCLVGVVNLQYTLNQVYCEDLVGGYQAGRRWGITDILGVEIDFDGFLSSAVKNGMHDLPGTLADLLRVQAWMTFFPAERDAWVSLEEVRQVLRSLPNAQCFPVPGAMHELRENPRVAQKVFDDIVTCCVAYATKVAPEKVQLQLPDKQNILLQNRAERDRLRDSVKTPDNERDFWASYLDKYRTVQNIEDYQNYISLAGRLLGEIKPGEILLDAGCGNGLFGLRLLRTLLDNARVMENPPVYIGLDLTVEGLRDAMDLQCSFIFERTQPSSRLAQDQLGLLFGQVDLDTWGMPHSEIGDQLAFADQTFDKVCFSLVLSYLSRPECILAELYRVLRPGGRIMVSSMKPFCDMSEIYRDYMAQKLNPTELEAGRNLLRAASKVRLKEEQGFYTFYSGDQLAVLLTEAGFRHCLVQPSFGGQAAIVVAEK